MSGRMKERAMAIRKHIRVNWTRGFYTELHWHGTYVRKAPVKTPASADDDVTLIGVYDGDVSVPELIDDIRHAMGSENMEAA